MFVRVVHMHKIKTRKHVKNRCIMDEQKKSENVTRVVTITNEFARAMNTLSVARKFIANHNLSKQFVEFVADKTMKANNLENAEVKQILIESIDTHKW